MDAGEHKIVYLIQPTTCFHRNGMEYSFLCTIAFSCKMKIVSFVMCMCNEHACYESVGLYEMRFDVCFRYDYLLNSSINVKCKQ